MDDDVRQQDDVAVEELTVGTGADTEKDVKDAVEPSPEPSPMRGPSLSTTADDEASVHSATGPAVEITAPESPTAPPQSATPPPPSLVTPAERRLRHRSAIEPRASNRLSGFFTNLIHRRDNTPVRSPQPPEQPPSADNSRPASPSRTRPSTPPPRLPAPSLHELGLSLSALTSDLSPAHFSTPPTSGAFLAPHYLLLCHAQGLDVLPLSAPPAPQPYALVRRVSFKSVVVMEQRGVLVAIAGRRDGVRVYALEEVKKAVEWRIDVEIRRERERNRREMVKKIALGTLDGTDLRDFSDKARKASLSTPPPSDPAPPGPLLRKSSASSVPSSATSPSTSNQPALVPRTPTIRRRPKSAKSLPPSQSSGYFPPPSDPQPSLLPPSYTSEEQSQPRASSSLVSVPVNRQRSGSITNVLGAAPDARRNSIVDRSDDPDAKVDWDQSSDDEAIDIVAAGASGSAALDERTSSQGTPSRPQPTAQEPVVVQTPSLSASSNPNRRSRPANLDLSNLSNGQIPPPEPSPVPTVWTLRQALAHPPSEGGQSDTPNEQFEEDDAVDNRISLAQILMESRIPDLPPAGTRRPQQPILIASHPVATGEEDASNSPRTSESHNQNNNQSQPNPEPSPSPSPAQTKNRRRRWSVMLTPSAGPSTSSPREQPTSPESTEPSSAVTPRERTPNRLTRSRSHRSNQSATSTVRPHAASNDNLITHSNSSRTSTPPMPETATIASASSSRSRFIPRFVSNAFHKSKEERDSVSRNSDSEVNKKSSSNATPSHAPPPKLEYVKLPGTKGALMVKAVETVKKSFLAILCGENGEKVELFAGTYRTALGLSRTFILPDSPRSLELQLQGDDLVEVFLVFSQNVFGLEPATVRVREVRIGRAERRAARRRAREIRGGESSNNDGEALGADEETNVNVSIGVSVSVGSTVVATGDGPNPDPDASAALIPGTHPSDQPNNGPPTPNDGQPATAAAHAEEVVALATAQMGPYTTFQQLTFSPKFPLASIADEYIIPPTYPDFMEYKKGEPEGETSGSMSLDLAQTQFSPPGLPVPTAAAPSKWFYRDPKNVVHGPWKASLMQAWYKDGLLPPDLPVRREEEINYTLLKDLRQQCVDPTHPFRSAPAAETPAATSAAATALSPSPPASDSLLPPISLLCQPRHFGPPALFFSSRGGHSTAIVDARGRSVLKGRFVWSDEEPNEDTKNAYMGRMGDVKRLEAFDVRDRSVLVAMRQGGLEAVDLSDALLKPADESRTALPQFDPPPSNINRRGPFVWKIGTPVSSSPTSSTVLTSKKPGLSHHLPGKKQGLASARSPARAEFSLGDAEDPQDEVLYLGRKEDEIYFCERNAGFFRILRLCPTM